MISSHQQFHCKNVCTYVIFLWTLITISSTTITTSCWTIRPVTTTRSSRMTTTTITAMNMNPLLIPLSFSSLRILKNSDDDSLYPSSCRSTSSCLYVRGNTKNKLPIIDAETTDDIIDNNNNNMNDDDIRLPKQRQKSSQDNRDPSIVSSSKSLIDVALETSSDYWKDIRVPFVEPIISSSSISTDNNSNSNSNSIEDGVMNYIDVKIAFIASIEGQQYAIATPYDSAVAIMVEDYSTGTSDTTSNNNNNNIKVQYLSPDNDDNVEIMEIMANRLQDSFGTDVFLKRTPRILTISGPFEENYMLDWQSLVTPQPLSSTELLKVISTNKNDYNNKDPVTENTKPNNRNDDDDEYVQYFHQFMKNELGDKTFNKIMKDGVDNSDIDDDDELTKALAQALNINLDDVDDDIVNDDNDDDFMNTKIDIALQSIMNNLDDDTLIEKELANILSESESSSTSSSSSSKSRTTTIKNMNNQGIAIKLISFIIPASGSGSAQESVQQKSKSNKKVDNNKSKAYSLVKLIKPHVLVARMIIPNSGSNSDDDDDDDTGENDENNNSISKNNNNIRFDLLSYDEERIVLPKIEEIFYKELNDSGLANNNI